MRLITATNTVLRKLGLEIHRYFPAVRYPPSIIISMRKFGIDLVLDIGANKGQYASELRRCGFGGRIVSFEPLTSAHNELLLASSRDPAWDVFPRCALGNYVGDVEINIAGNSESSSILPMADAHCRAAPEALYQGKECAPIETLDAIFDQCLQGARSPLLKIDTQGFEWQVLDGARNTLPHIKGILVELSLVTLYEGQHLWREMIDRLEAEGFTLWEFQPVFSDLALGRTLQVDGVFYRNS